MGKGEQCLMEVMKAQGVTKAFGGVHAVSNVSFGVETGEHLVILGPNGAGKTTLFNMLTGQLKPTRGQLFFQGEDITNLPAHRRIHLGIGRSFQITSLFNGLNVMDNMLLAVQGTKAERYQMVRPLKRNRQLMDKAGELLDSFDLWNFKNELVSCISYGAQRKLEIALSMASDPKLLLLDEPSSGLTAAEGAELCTRISNLGKDISLICIAHDMDLVFGIATRILLLHYGKVIIEGTPEQIKDSPIVKEIYMGSEQKTN
jgi:branched-chain amino acid transport system ATP-binding protein